MADQTENISNIEDIGERLDALLDALEQSSQEVAKVGASLGKPLDEIETAEAIQRGAMLDDSGRAIEAPASRAALEESEEAMEPAAADDKQAERAAEPLDDAEATADAESELDAAEMPEQRPEAQDISDGATEAEAASIPEPEFQPEPVAAAEAVDEPDAEPEDQPVAETGPEPEAVEETELDDGLLIEPERAEQQPERLGDIDGAPAGPSSLEDELDEELDALLASGMFEDPLVDMEGGESAAPLELPEEEPEPVAAGPNDSAIRKPNLPTDEAELIGELDEQLAALADAQLAEDAAEEPVPEPAPAAAPAPAESPAATRAEQAEPAKPEPVVQTRQLTPSKGGFKAAAARAAKKSRPVVSRGLQRAKVVAIAAAARANAPLQDKPQLKQIVGWVALVHAFYAMCLWAYVVMWHNPPPPAPKTTQPTLETSQSQ